MQNPTGEENSGCGAELRTRLHEGAEAPPPSVARNRLRNGDRDPRDIGRFRHPQENAKSTGQPERGRRKGCEQDPNRPPGHRRGERLARPQAVGKPTPERLHAQGERAQHRTDDRGSPMIGVCPGRRGDAEVRAIRPEQHIPYEEEDDAHRPRYRPSLRRDSWNRFGLDAGDAHGQSPLTVLLSTVRQPPGYCQLTMVVPEIRDTGRLASSVERYPTIPSPRNSSMIRSTSRRTRSLSAPKRVHTVSTISSRVCSPSQSRRISPAVTFRTWTLLRPPSWTSTSSPTTRISRPAVIVGLRALSIS